MVKIDRARRVGNRSVGKTRPIVAKLMGTKDKELIKQASKAVGLRKTESRVADQYPPEVMARRKELIPKMMEVRNGGNRAWLPVPEMSAKKIIFRMESCGHLPA